MAILLLRLAGPMQSWGIQSRFSNRDTALEPSKSGIIGLLCSAVGIPRDESSLQSGQKPAWPGLKDLRELKMGVRIDYPGRVERDYQTSGGSHLQKDSGYGVPVADGTSKRTITSDRFYLADAVFLVALQGDLKLINHLFQALQRPRWQVYLGRKSYLPSCPVWLRDGILPEENDLKKALQSYPYLCPTRKNLPDILRLEIETEYGNGDKVKPDQPESFSTTERSFSLRSVVTDYIERKLLPLTEEDICIFPD